MKKTRLCLAAVAGVTLLLFTLIASSQAAPIVPEPATMLLLGTGLLALAKIRRKLRP